MKTLWRSPFLTLVLVALDAVALSQIWAGVYELRAWSDQFAWFPRPINAPDTYRAALPVLLFFWLCVLAHFRFYSHHERIADLTRLSAVFWAAVWLMVVAMIYNTVYKADFGRSIVGGLGLGAAIWLLLSRALFRMLKRRAVARGHGLVRALVVGGGDLGVETMMRVREHPDIGFRIVGYLDSENGGEAGGEIMGTPVLGGLDELPAMLRRHRVEELFVAVPEMDEDDTFGLIETAQDQGRVTVKVVANLLYVVANRAKVDEITGLPVIAFPPGGLNRFQEAVKRAIDLVLGSLLTLLLVPPSALFALLIRLDSPGPVLFVHERVGRGGRPFRLIKFRTMRCDAEPYAEAPVDQTDGRVTRVGRFLRRTSLDEIPQLLNVLRGDMSLVGPRPEMPFIVQTYKPWQTARLRVKPGLTGLWQVAGRKNLPLHFNLEYDYYYVKNQSLSLDTEILVRTIPAVLLGKGAY